MPRIPNRFGGGARTNANGLEFEQTTSLDTALERAGFEVRRCEVYENGGLIGLSVPQNSIYSNFLEGKGIDYRRYNSKKWHPDECFINFGNRTAYIIEKKFQNCAGSVDEKLPGCHFKKQEYEKLFHPLGIEVEFMYIFNDWFRDPRYRDTLDYIVQMGCNYYFNEIPLRALGLY